MNSLNFYFFCIRYQIKLSIVATRILIGFKLETKPNKLCIPLVTKPDLWQIKSFGCLWCEMSVWGRLKPVQSHGCVLHGYWIYEIRNPIALCYFEIEKACSEARGNYLLNEMNVAKFSTQYHWYSIFNNRFLCSQFHIFWEAIFSVLQFSNICEFYGSIDLKIRFERYKYIKRSLKIRFFSRYIKT